MPTVTISLITNITTNSASGGGNVLSDGGAAVTAYLVYMSRFPDGVKRGILGLGKQEIVLDTLEVAEAGHYLNHCPIHTSTPPPDSSLPLYKIVRSQLVKQLPLTLLLLLQISTSSIPFYRRSSQAIYAWHTS